MSAFAGDATWNGGTGSWNTTGEWTSTPADNFPRNGNAGQNWNATINSGNSALDVENITIRQLTLADGVVSGAFNLTTAGLLTWSNGTMSGPGTTTANGGILMSDSFAGRLLSERTLTNPAGRTATMIGNSHLYFATSAVLNNAGTFLAQSDGNGFLNWDSTGGTFNNIATFTRNTGTGTFVVQSPIVFKNSGTTNVETGTLNLQGGDGGSTIGDFNVSGGATLNFSSDFTFANTASFSGEGEVLLSSGGTSTFNGTFASTADKVSLAGGTLTGTGTFESNGLLTWSGGTMSGPGTTTAKGGILMNSSNGNSLLSERTLTNTAGNTATISSDSSLYLASSAVLNNAGTFLAQTNNGYGLLTWDGTSGTFNNIATFTRNTGTGTFVVQSPIVFKNSGTTNVETGTLDLQGGDGGSTTGDFNVSGGATLNFSSNFTFANTAGFSGAGEVLLSNQRRRYTSLGAHPHQYRRQNRHHERRQLPLFGQQRGLEQRWHLSRSDQQRLRAFEL